MKNKKLKKMFLIIVLIIYAFLFLNMPVVIGTSEIDKTLKEADDFVKLGSRFPIIRSEKYI